MRNDIDNQFEKRYVFGYRGKDGDLCDNLVCVASRDYNQAVEVMKLNCLMAFSRVQMRRLTGIEVVRLGVWHKDDNKFLFTKKPEKCFVLGEDLFKEYDNLNGEK